MFACFWFRGLALPMFNPVPLVRTLPDVVQSGENLLEEERGTGLFRAKFVLETSLP